MLEKLGAGLKEAMNRIAKAMFVDEKLIDEIIREIQRAMLQSDVNVKLVLELTKKIKERALKEDAPGLSKKEQLTKTIYEETVKFLGSGKNELNTAKKNSRIMLTGLFGSGKTTLAGKLGKYYKKRGKKTILIGLDVWRPAAMEQLEQVAKTAQVDCITDKKEKNPEKIWRSAEEKIKQYDIIIIDTAGRDALSKELIEEIELITRITKPDEKLLVISADIGQAAQKQAEQFHKSCGITGIVITKMEGTAKGGGALSACAATNAPVKFIGTGEKTDDIEQFNPAGFVSRMLGMGDIEALIEKAKEAISEEDAKDLEKKLLKGEFSLVDLYEQMEAMNKMGPLSKIVEMIPGFSQIKMPKETLQVQEGKLKKWRHIMDSCTKEELEDPEKIDSKRIERIAKGSGTSVTEVRELLKQYKMSKKLVKTLGGSEKKMERMMQKMGNIKMK
jgi:signal recognition particle subunit SRP54